MPHIPVSAFSIVGSHAFTNFHVLYILQISELEFSMFMYSGRKKIVKDLCFIAKALVLTQNTEGGFYSIFYNFGNGNAMEGNISRFFMY